MLTIVTEPSVDEAYEAACLRWPKAHDVWEAITWALSREPREGRALTESGNVRAYTLEGARSVGWPTLTVLYRTENGHVVIYDAEFTEAKYGQAGRA